MLGTGNFESALRSPSTSAMASAEAMVDSLGSYLFLLYLPTFNTPSQSDFGNNVFDRNKDGNHT